MSSARQDSASLLLPAGSGNRGPSTLSKKARRNSSVKIFEDPTAAAVFSGESIEARRRSIFAQPAKRPVLPAVLENSASCAPDHGHNIPSATDEMRRSSRREDRRRTIWIPQDDTTIMTIHPGAHTQTLKDETIRLANAITASIIDPPLEVRCTGRPRKKRLSLLEAPRRAPLAASKNVPVNAVFGDVPGPPTGKENIPDTVEIPRAKTYEDVRRQQIAGVRRSIAPVLETAEDGPLQSQEVPVRLVTAADQTRAPSHKHRPVDYSISEENIAQPELIENDWLRHQEISLTEIVNDILAQDQAKDHFALDSEFQLMTLLGHQYQNDDFANLSRRLSTSLHTGTLSILSPEISRIIDDVGFRKQFLRLWLDSYDNRLLRAAAEAVTAGLCKQENDSIAYTQTRNGKCSERVLLGRFLWARLGADGSISTQRTRNIHGTSSWQDMVLRCLDIILLLDTACKSGVVTGCLFQSSSTYKSSEGFIKALGALVIPSVPEIGRLPALS